MRYSTTPILKTLRGKNYYKGVIYPQIIPKETDIYVITTVGDRLDIIADQYYNDVNLWWIISSSNNIKKDSIFIRPGTQLRIPTDIEEYLKEFNNLNINR